MILECGIGTDWNWNSIKNVLSYASGHRDRNYIYNFGLVKEKASLKLGGGLSTWCTHAPIMSSQEELSYRIFMLGFLIMIRPCSILLQLVPLWRKLLNSNGIFWKELNATLMMGIMIRRGFAECHAPRSIPPWQTQKISSHYNVWIFSLLMPTKHNSKLLYVCRWQQEELAVFFGFHSFMSLCVSRGLNAG